ncbi:unnamed protein product [Lymnaea stagnalis]|uniref:Hexosyltransferase n=1 Tax=Lymnaea stagnalis TaxID=6523 RepID=A0AAV2HW75_LYMST
MPPLKSAGRLTKVGRQQMACICLCTTVTILQTAVLLVNSYTNVGLIQLQAKRLTAQELKTDTTHKMEAIRSNSSDVTHKTGGRLSKFIFESRKLEYIHNPRQICAKEGLELIIVRTAEVGDLSSRTNARTMYYETVRELPTTLVFVVGVSLHDPEVQTLVDEEVDRYGDILQLDFPDSDLTTTLKSVSILKWVSEFCSHVKFVLKMNVGETVEDFNDLIVALYRQSYSHEEFILGKIRYYGGMSLENTSARRPGGLPDKSLGPTYGYPGKVAARLYLSALRIPFFYIEHIYITGWCARDANLLLLNDNNFS